MPRLDISEVINDPDFCSDFIVHRTTGTFVGGRFTPTTTPLPVTGIIEPHDEKEIVQLPPGDSIQGSIDIYTHKQLNTTILAKETWEPDRLSDEVEWHGYRYKVINSLPWGDFGYYRSLAVRKFGA